MAGGLMILQVELHPALSFPVSLHPKPACSTSAKGLGSHLVM